MFTTTTTTTTSTPTTTTTTTTTTRSLREVTCQFVNLFAPGARNPEKCAPDSLGSKQRAAQEVHTTHTTYVVCISCVSKIIIHKK